MNNIIKKLPEYLKGILNFCNFLIWETGEDKMLIVSVGTGAAPEEGVYKNLVDTATSISTNLMYAMQIDQDISCRTIDRCIYGDTIDRELGNMISDNPLSLNTGKDFLYIRYNVELTKNGLESIGIKNINPEKIGKTDSVKNINQLKQVGEAASKQVLIKHFETFI